MPPSDVKGVAMRSNELQELISGARDAVTGRRVYGEPYEKNGLTVIPAAIIRGGAGAGAGQQGDEDAGGAGGGFGIVARPVGAWVIRGDRATWKPAIDVNRIVLGGQIVALASVFTLGRVLATRRRHRVPRIRIGRRLPRARVHVRPPAM